VTQLKRNFKHEAAQLWTETPCGSLDDAALEPASPAYFVAVDTDRYEHYAPWLRPAVDFQRFRGKDVLEIGFGQGTDLMQFARAGASSVHGLDLSPAHLKLATRRFQLANVVADLRIHDAEQRWPFADESLDVVYSFGVLHHTPDPLIALREAYRCLRPEGTVLIALYHSYSLFSLARFLEWLRHGEWRTESFSESFWRIERPAPGTTARPLVDRYSRAETQGLLAGAGFEVRRTEVHHYGVEEVWYLGWIPRAARDWLSRRLGWYVLVEGRKRGSASSDRVARGTDRPTTDA
jgi:SAM-dependent methyltransferase